MKAKTFEHDTLGTLRALVYKEIVFFVGRDVLATVGRNVSNFSNVAKHCNNLRRVKLDGKSMMIISLSDALAIVENTKLEQEQKKETKQLLTTIASELMNTTHKRKSLEQLKVMAETSFGRLNKITNKLEQEQKRMETLLNEIKQTLT